MLAGSRASTVKNGLDEATPPRQVVQASGAEAEGKAEPPPRAEARAGAEKAKRTRRAKPTVPTDRKAIAALEREIRRLRLARGRLERRLTAAVQEIGMLRQFELRVPRGSRPSSLVARA